MTTEPCWLPLDAAVGINQRVVGEFGGRHEILDLPGLRLALASPWNLWVYSKVVDPAALAAALFVDMASIRAFADGNRRTAFLCAAALIEANGFSLAMPDSEVSAEKLRGFAERRFGERAAAAWLGEWIER